MTEDEFVGWCVEEYGPQADGEEAASRGGPPGPNPPSRWHGTYLVGYRDDKPDTVFFVGHSGD